MRVIQRKHDPRRRLGLHCSRVERTSSSSRVSFFLRAQAVWVRHISTTTSIEFDGLTPGVSSMGLTHRTLGRSLSFLPVQWKVFILACWQVYTVGTYSLLVAVAGRDAVRDWMEAMNHWASNKNIFLHDCVWDQITTFIMEFKCTLWVKKQDTVTSPNVYRFSKFFRCYRLSKFAIVIFKNPTTPSSCRYTNLWNICFKNRHA